MTSESTPDGAGAGSGAGAGDDSIFTSCAVEAGNSSSESSLKRSSTLTPFSVVPSTGASGSSSSSVRGDSAGDTGCGMAGNLLSSFNLKMCCVKYWRMPYADDAETRRRVSTRRALGPKSRALDLYARNGKIS